MHVCVCAWISEYSLIQKTIIHTHTHTHIHRYNVDCRVTITDEAWERIKEGRRVVDDLLVRGDTVYGINTGFGVGSTYVCACV
jgi:histidine ammonia-lyase